MTLDELRSDYNRGFWSVPEAAGLQAQQNAGIAAVIRALRDDMRYMMINRDSIDDMFDKILGDAGNEKVAGGSSSNADKATEAGGARCATPCASAPATDPIRNAVATARGRALAVDDIPTLNKLAAMMSPATDPAPANRKHPSHETRISFDASSYDEICVRCGATDRIGSWGRLAEPCSKPAPAVCEWRDDAYIGCFTTSCSDDAAWNRLGGAPKDEGYNFCPSCGKPISFKTEA